MTKRKKSHKKKRSKTDYIYIEQKGKGKYDKDMILTIREYRRGVKRHKKW